MKLDPTAALFGRRSLCWIQFIGRLVGLAVLIHLVLDPENTDRATTTWRDDLELAGGYALLMLKVLVCQIVLLFGSSCWRAWRARGQ